MVIMLHVSDRVLSFSERVVRPCCRKALPENYYPYVLTFLLNFAIPSCFPYILFNHYLFSFSSKFCFSMLLPYLIYHYLFSLLSSGWFVIAICGFVSVRESVK